MSERKQKIFVISDTHFNHANIIKYCNRPFESVYWMNEKMINNWNAVVRPQDIIIHCGDFAFTSHSNTKAAAEIAALTNSLNGHKILIKGNHDHKKVRYTECGWDYECYQELQIDRLIFEHIPEQVHGQVKVSWKEGEPHDVTLKHWLNGDYKNDGIPRHIFYGHVHDRGVAQGNGYTCVCVELTNFTPLDITDFLTDNEYDKICKLVEA